jgi:protein-L-isoaspartate(D-aspartate) O-methyltransferase
VDILKEKGIIDSGVLAAIGNIPRHYFLDDAFDEWAYKDQAFPIDADQTISQPYTVARMTELLNVKEGDKILEIGTGSGYQACVLAYLKAKVYTIERQEELFIKTAEFLPKINFGHIRTLFGDGYKGSPRFAPFDKILVTAGAVDMPNQLLEQLKVGGIMVIPFGDAAVQRMLRIKKESSHKYIREDHGSFAFVPFVKGVVKKN